METLGIIVISGILVNLLSWLMTTLLETLWHRSQKG